MSLLPFSRTAVLVKIFYLSSAHKALPSLVLYILLFFLSFVRSARSWDRSTSIINALPRVSYSAAKRTTGDDVK